MGRVQMLDQHKCHACLNWQFSQQAGERLQASGRSSDTDYRKGLSCNGSSFPFLFWAGCQVRLVGIAPGSFFLRRRLFPCRGWLGPPGRGRRPFSFWFGGFLYHFQYAGGDTNPLSSHVLWIWLHHSILLAIPSTYQANLASCGYSFCCQWSARFFARVDSNLAPCDWILRTTDNEIEIQSNGTGIPLAWTLPRLIREKSPYVYRMFTDESFCPDNGALGNEFCVPTQVIKAGQKSACEKCGMRRLPADKSPVTPFRLLILSLAG